MTADLRLTRWIGAATLLNELVVPTLDTNGPLWSLAYEWFYYIVALAGVLLYRRSGGKGAVSVIVYGGLLLLISIFNQPDIPTSGISWGAGWLAREAFKRRIWRGKVTFVVGLTVVLFVLILDRKHPTPDPVLGLALAFLISHDVWARWNWGANWGEKLANFSYSLYAVHFPLLLTFMGLLYSLGKLQHRMPFNTTGLATCIVALAFSVLGARAFAFLTEDRTSHLKEILKRVLLD
jgi:peptidoglycan/LPS O-acetylase OafA/YrhL